MAAAVVVRGRTVSGEVELPRTIFHDDRGEWKYPLMTGGSAGVNNAMFFACPLCGAAVLDMYHDAGNRIRHHEWHEASP